VHPPGLPESFNVLVRELQSLGLSIELFVSEGGSPNQKSE
jgi:DNA-directed RNA polymerase beta subunit